MRTQVERISPQRASQMLSLNTHNRPVSRFHVDRLASAMERGQWKTTGQGIQMNGTRLLDGQHRLMAVVQSGVTVDMLVCYDVPCEAFTVIDTGKARTPSDSLSMMGVDNYKVVSSGSRMVMAYDGGALSPSRSTGGGTSKWSVTNEDICEFVRSNLRIVDLSNVIMDGIRGKTFGCRPSAVLASYFIFDRIDTEDAEYFVDKWKTGAGLDDDSPILLLRRQFSNYLARFQTVGPNVAMCFAFKAWNAYRTNTTVRLFRSGDSVPSLV